MVDGPPMDQLHWGILAVDAATGEVLYQRNAHRKFVPASNAKILVTAAALLEMGPEHRFVTEVWATGAFNGEGVVSGDLVIPGDGDPTLSRRYWVDDEAPLRALVDSLRRSGVRQVGGQLVVDASRWDTVPSPASWMVGNLPWGFSALGAPFALAEGTTTVVVEATDPGAPARIRWIPGGSQGFVEGEVLTVSAADTAAGVNVTWLAEAERHVLWGTIPDGEVDTLAISTRVPAREAGVRLLQLLDSAGIPVAGGIDVIREPGVPLGGGCVSGEVAGCLGARRVAALTSPPLSHVVRGILEPSQNWMTEQLVRALAVHLGEVGSWSHGLSAVSGILRREAGVDSLDLALHDGSGLSAYNLVTPRAVVAVLRRMHASPLSGIYRDALAAPGEKESTMEERLPGLAGRVQAKTGTISNVNSLSGYLVTDSGREVVFSILTNGSGLPSREVRTRIDELVETLARYR